MACKKFMSVKIGIGLIAVMCVEVSAAYLNRAIPQMYFQSASIPFDRHLLIPIDKGKLSESHDIPESPKESTQINVADGRPSGFIEKLKAEDIIPYLREKNKSYSTEVNLQINAYNQLRDY